MQQDERDDFTLVINASLTLLALIIGFSFSMAVSRYDQRKTPPVTLTVWGMNDVLNRQGYTQAAWWNRIPFAAWGLRVFLAICCSLLVGYGSRRRERFLFTVLPFLVSVAFFLIADIDSPRTGVIRVPPQNLISLSRSLHKP